MFLLGADPARAVPLLETLRLTRFMGTFLFPTLRLCPLRERP